MLYKVTFEQAIKISPISFIIIKSKVLLERDCSNLWYSWVTCVIFSNFCNFSQLVLSTHPLLLYQQCYLYTFYVIYAPYKCTCCTHHKHNPLSRLIVRTLSAPIRFSNSSGVFGYRAILILGDRDMAGGFRSKNSLLPAGLLKGRVSNCFLVWI